MISTVSNVIVVIVDHHRTLFQNVADVAVKMIFAVELFCVVSSNKCNLDVLDFEYYYYVDHMMCLDSVLDLRTLPTHTHTRIRI